MRTLTALAALLTAAFVPSGLFAQGRRGGGGGQRGGYPGGSSGAVVVQPVGALGGSFAGQGSSRPLGGIAPPSYPVGVRPPSPTPPPGRGNHGYRYVGPVYYVPNAFGTTFTEPEPADPDTNPAYNPIVPPRPVRGMNSPVQFSDALPTAQPQTVIVNQYYGKDEAPLNSGKTTPMGSAANAVAPSDYYLIAYKNRHVITALAYWVDGETLHYVTAPNAHNQSSLSLIDLDLTTRLNADREVPFAITGK